MYYKCNQCGAPLTYSPEKKAMYCGHCDGINTEALTPGSSGAQCTNCGAPLTIKPYASAMQCEHCGCYLILDEGVSGQYQPHLILPFSVGRESAKDIIKNHLKSNTFLPSGFVKEANLNTIEGEYVPFWLFDYQANFNYEAKATRVRHWTSGDTAYTETSVYMLYRNMDIDYQLIPADASKAMDDKKMDLVEPYDYSALTKFDTKYMSGFTAEVYNFYANELEPRAREKAASYSKKLMDDTVSGYASVTPVVQDLLINTTAQNYALMPVWAYRYTYDNKIYEFFINGQTGKIVGEAPVSKPKAFLYSAFMFLSLTAILFLGWAILEVL